MHVLIRTFSYPSVALHRDQSQMLCAKGGHAAAQVQGPPHATALEASLTPGWGGGVYGESRVLIHLPVDCISLGLFLFKPPPVVSQCLT